MTTQHEEDKELVTFAMLMDVWEKNKDRIIKEINEEELICGENNGGGCGRKGWKLDSGAIQFGCECGDTEEDDIACGDCDYTITKGEFDIGKGRIMFNDINEDGTEYRCGCCDDRVADPMGMYPNDEEEEDDEVKGEVAGETILFGNKFIEEKQCRDCEYCEYCGGYNSEDEDNCDNCGRTLEEAE